MKKKLFPAIGIIVVAGILVAINHFTESTIIKDYAIVFIIAGMFLGVGLGKLKSKKNNHD